MNKTYEEGYLNGVHDERERLEKIINEAIKYITSYEAISTIQGLDNIEENKQLDEKTMNKMIYRYLIVHHKLLEILRGERLKNNLIFHAYLCLKRKE